MSAERVRAFWRGLGLPGLVDAHVHFLPDPVMRKVWAYFDRAEEHYGRSWPVRYRLDQPARLALLREFGVRAFPALTYPHKPGMAAWLNRWGVEFAAGRPDVVPSGTFFAEEAAAGYVTAAVDAGVRVFKVHLQVGGFDPRAEVLRPVWGLLAEAGLPVVVHAGSGPLPGAFTGPGPIGEVLDAHPRLVLVVAHLGMPEYAAFLDLAEGHPGVHLDTTMAFTDFVEAVAPFPVGLRPRLAALAERIVLGSDFPNVPYPYHHQLEALARLELGPDWLRAVCWTNGARLLGVDSTAQLHRG